MKVIHRNKKMTPKVVLRQSETPTLYSIIHYDMSCVVEDLEKLIKGEKLYDSDFSLKRAHAHIDRLERISRIPGFLDDFNNLSNISK